MPPLCLKELHDLALVWNHPQWVTRVLHYFKYAVLKDSLPLDSMRMSPQWDDGAQKPLLCNLSEEHKKDTTVWAEVVGAGGASGDTPTDGSLDTPPAVLSLNSSAVVMIESLWLLVWSSIHCYKERYETESSSSQQASADVDFTASMSLGGGGRLKKVMLCWFKVVDGVGSFEVHKGEWVGSYSAQVGPCKTCKGHGLIERHWVWICLRPE